MGNLCTRPPSTLEEDLGLAEKKKKKKPLSTSAAAAMASSSSSLPRSFNRSGSISSSSSPTHRAIRLLVVVAMVTGQMPQVVLGLVGLNLPPSTTH